MPQLLTLFDSPSDYCPSSSFFEVACKRTILDEAVIESERLGTSFSNCPGHCGMHRVGDTYGVESMVSGSPGHCPNGAMQQEFLSTRRAPEQHHQLLHHSQLRAAEHDLTNGYTKTETDSGNNALDVDNSNRSAASSDGQSSSDAKSGDYSLVQHERLNNRYHVVEFLGRGTFGQVVKCLDTSTHDYVAIKILKNHPSYIRQGQVEVSILRLLNTYCADHYNFVLSSEWFSHRGHSCVVFEMLQLNLYDYLKQSNFQPMRLHAIRPILQQVAHALCKLKDLGIIHADLKPENIMLVDQERLPYRVKVIDFGSALHTTKAVSSTYLQSRYYRAPEVILSLPFGESIDVWSLGCVVAELFLGWPLFPGASEYMQMKYIVETVGMVPFDMIERSTKKHKFFRQNYGAWMLNPTHGRGEEPKEARKYILRNLREMANIGLPGGLTVHEQAVEKADKEEFLHLLQFMLTIDPTSRAEPQSILRHLFVTGNHLKNMAQSPALQLPVHMALEPMAVCDKATATHVYCPVHSQSRRSVSSNVAAVLTPIQSPQAHLAITPTQLPLTPAIDPIAQAQHLVMQRLNGTQVFLNTPTHTCRENVHAPLMPLHVPFCMDTQPPILVPALPSYSDGTMAAVGNESLPALISVPAGTTLLSSAVVPSSTADCNMSNHGEVTLADWSGVSRSPWVSATTSILGMPSHISASMPPNSVTYSSEFAVMNLTNSLSSLSAQAPISHSTQASFDDPQTVYLVGQDSVYPSSGQSSDSSAPCRSPVLSRSDTPVDIPNSLAFQAIAQRDSYPNLSEVIDLDHSANSYSGEPSAAVLHHHLAKSFSGGSRGTKQRLQAEKMRASGHRSRFLSLGHTPPGNHRSSATHQPMSSDVVDAYCLPSPSVYSHPFQASNGHNSVPGAQRLTVDAFQASPAHHQAMSALHTPSSHYAPPHHQRAQSFAGSSLSMTNLQSVPSPDSIGHAHLPSPFVTPLVAGLPVAATSLGAGPLSAPAIAGPQQMFVFPSNPSVASEIVVNGTATAVAVPSHSLSNATVYDNTQRLHMSTAPHGTMLMLDRFQLPPNS